MKSTTWVNNITALSTSTDDLGKKMQRYMTQEFAFVLLWCMKHFFGKDVANAFLRDLL